MTDGWPAIRNTAYTYHPVRPSMLTLLQEMHGAMIPADAPLNYKRRAFLEKVEALKPRMLEMHAKKISVSKMAVELGLTYCSAYETLQECKRQAGMQ